MVDLGSSGEELVGGRAGRGELVEFMGYFLAGFAVRWWSCFLIDLGRADF